MKGLACDGALISSLSDTMHTLQVGKVECNGSLEQQNVFSCHVYMRHVLRLERLGSKLASSNKVLTVFLACGSCMQNNSHYEQPPHKRMLAFKTLVVFSTLLQQLMVIDEHR